MKRVIAFTGYKESGKSFLANHVRAFVSCEVLSFASPLKNALIEIYDYPYCFYDSKMKEEQHPMSKHTVRRLMQQMGDFIKSLDNDIFVERMCLSIQQSISDVIVIDDLRFDVEAHGLTEFCAHNDCILTIVKVTAKDENRGDTHISEAGISNAYVSMTIQNDKKTSPDLLLKPLNLK